MANEINLNVSLSASKSGASVSLSKSKTATIAGSNLFTGTQSVGTTAELIAVPSDLTDAQYIAITNLDATNYVELALDSGVSTSKFAKLQPGDPFFVPPNSGSMAIYGKANTASCLIQVVVVGS